MIHNKRRRLNSPICIQRYVYMATRSKQSAEDSNPDNTKVPRAVWTPEDETSFITCLLKHKSEAGDGGNFKGSTWSLVAKEMNGLKTKGGEKTSETCKNKWARVCNINSAFLFFLVNNIIFRSRIHIKLFIPSRTYPASPGHQITGSVLPIIRRKSRRMFGMHTSLCVSFFFL